ncbi:hypothetical protein GCK72_022754 [Caenorhabditis remanei]|uniref:Uncharacterized protein n=1 Tax=Caenorhabditis remanei TaxID=31234 RepID=A0A6A5FV77_CAERE|nr:hypothetical protein GCK72_022754 [Caenorhabditis remanei]KAF1746301.1 hypothetical protein GCK72_022754 [Caenorhabditis remanei]
MGVTREIFYDGTRIGGTICQNIDPSYLTAVEKEKMAELRRSQGIPVFEGYDPEALVKVKNLIELEEINTAIGEESAALRVNNRTLTRYNEQLKLDNKNMRQYFVSQHEADTAAKDKEIEKQKDAKKKAKEKLRAERKNNEIFVAQKWTRILHPEFDTIEDDVFATNEANNITEAEESQNPCSIKTRKRHEGISASISNFPKVRKISSDNPTQYCFKSALETRAKPWTTFEDMLKTFKDKCHVALNVA